jgi:hypothetical protein
MALPAHKARMTMKAESPLIRPKLALLKRLVMTACLVLLASHPAAALEQVSLQLKWKHQFQFAGYYAALEQGSIGMQGSTSPSARAAPMSTPPKRLPAARRSSASAAPAFCANW